MTGAESAVAALVVTAAELVDAADFGGLASLLSAAEVTTDRSSEPFRGVTDIRRMYESWTRLYADGTPRTRQLATNMVIDVDEGDGTATCRSSYTVIQQTPDLPLQPVMAGRYLDGFERVDGVWRFTHRHIVVDLIGDLSGFMRPPPPHDH